MVGGPSWKPLPVVFTTLFAFAGSGAAPLLWLVLARAGGFLAVVMAYRVTARARRPHRAGSLAAAGLALGTDYLFNVLRGDSEGLARRAVPARRRPAPQRPPARGARRRAARRAGAAGGVAAARRLRAPPAARRVTAGPLVALRRGRRRPRCSSPGSCPTTWRRATGCAAPTAPATPSPARPASRASRSGLTFVYATIFLPWPLYAGAVYAVRQARTPFVRTLALAAAALMVTVALLAEVGFTGNIRYVTLPMAAVCVLGGLGLPRARPARAPPGSRVPAGDRGRGQRRHRGQRRASASPRDERDLGARARRRASPRRAARPRSAPAAGSRRRRSSASAVAYRLRLPSRDVWTHAVTPGIGAGPRREGAAGRGDAAGPSAASELDRALAAAA